MAYGERPQKVIDMKLPLTWLVGSAITIIALVVTVTWNASAQTQKLENKIDQLIGNTSKLEKRLDDRDDRMESLRERMYKVDRTTDSLNTRIEQLERNQQQHR